LLRGKWEKTFGWTFSVLQKKSLNYVTIENSEPYTVFALADLDLDYRLFQLSALNPSFVQFIKPRE